MSRQDHQIRVALFVLALVIASLSQFLRTAHGVIGPTLIRELQLSPSEFAALSGMFFLLAACCQLPAGALFDTVGPRRIVAASLLLTALGVGGFALADSATGLISARALMGLGCGSLVMGCLVLYARWFPPGRFAILLSVTLGVSQAGNLLATTPMAWLSDLAGWRLVFLWAAAVPVVLALLVWVLLRDNPGEEDAESTRKPPATGVSLWRGVFTLLFDRRLWPLFAMAASGYASMIAILGLWGGTYLHDVHGMAPVDGGMVLLAMTLALALAQFMVGPMIRLCGTLRDTSWVMMLPGVCSLLVLGALPGPAPWLVVGLMVLIGASGASTSPMVAHGRAFYPGSLTGRGMTLTNSFVTLGVFLVQWGSGLVIRALVPEGAVRIPEEAFRVAFVLIGLLWLAAGVWFRCGPLAPGDVGRRGG